jgi:hypothetical protein
VWRKLILLIGGLLTLWVLVAVPARHLLGNWAVAYSGTAFLICLIPAIGTFLWVSWTREHASDSVPMIFLAGTGVRLFVVSVAALVLTNVPFYSEHEYFWAWLLFFYLASLALEVAFLLSGGGLNNK